MYDLNIMPVENKQVLRDMAITRVAVRISIRLWFLCLILVGFILGTRNYFDTRIHNEQQVLDDIKRTKSDGQLPINEIIKTLNSETSVIAPLSRDLPVDSILTTVASAIPAAISLTDISFVAASNELSINGIAAARKDVPVFEQSMTSLSILKSVSISSSIADRERIPVSMTAVVTQGKLNPQ